MKGAVIKSLILTIIFISGLYSFKYFLKFSVSSIFNLPFKAESPGFPIYNTETDTSIVIVNIAWLDRGQIADVLNIVAKNKPSVIAFNFCFDKNKVSQYDSTLQKSIDSSSNIVLMKFDEGCIFSRKAQYGKQEFVIGKDGIVRTFSTDSSALSSVITKLYNKKLYEKLKERKTGQELINYIGNYNHFVTINADLILSGLLDEDTFKNKIVLIGYIGTQNPGSHQEEEETFSTPVSGPWSSKMYATEISANILHTILREKYITVVPVFICFIIYLVVLIFNSVLGYLALKKSRRIFALILSLLVLSESFIAAFLMITLFKKNIILDIEDLPFIILGGFLILYFLLRYTLCKPSEEKSNNLN
jgi:CHASE2 domain-containing sensor protein